MHQKNQCVSYLEVETDSAIYDIELGPIQIEITGRCNMNCRHCRASEMRKTDMPLAEILKIIRFARTYSPGYKEVTISGGEPLMHHKFHKVMEGIRENDANFVTITTNGSLVTDELLDFFQELQFERLVLSISVDSTDSKAHDEFRNFPGAFDKATNALRKIAELKDETIVPSMKTVILPNQILEMPDRVALADRLGCRRISFTSVIYSGKAINNHRFWMSFTEKKEFLETIYRLKKLYPHINVTTNDPLKCLVRGINDEPKDDSEIVMDGCPAGTVTFNVNSDGTMTPCSLLNVPMMNTFELSETEIAERYRSNPYTKAFLDMELKGKCGACAKKYLCSGCRARAYTYHGDIMGEDPECWL